MRFPPYVFLSLVLAVCALPSMLQAHDEAASFAAGPIPDWVDAWQTDTLPETGGDVDNGRGHVGILDDVQVRYTSEGRQHYRHLIFKVLNARGARDNIVSTYFSDSKKADHGVIHLIRQTKKDGRAFQVSVEEILTRGSWLSGFRLPNLDVGDIIEIQYTSFYRYKGETDIFFDVLFVSSFEASDHRFSMLFPKSMPLFVDGMPPYLDFSESKDGGDHLLSWNGRLKENNNDDDTFLENGEFGYRVRVTTIDSWEEYSARVFRLVKRHYPPPPELIQIASEIEVAHSTKMDRINAVVNFMSAEIGSYGKWGLERYDWSLPDFVKVRKFRRCDDFACIALLAAFFDQLDIDYDYALAGRGGLVLGEYADPMATPNNGMVFRPVLLAHADSGDILIEIEWHDLRSRPLSENSDLEYLLPVHPQGAELQKLEREFPQEGKFSINRYFDLRRSGKDYFELQEEFFGRNTYLLFEEVNHIDRRLDKLNLSYPGLTGVDLGVSETSNKENERAASYAFKIPARWLQVAGASNAEFFIFNHVVSRALKLPRHIGSSSLFDQLLFQGTFEVEIVVDLPANKNWTMSAFSETVSNAYFTFDVIQKLDGDRLTRTYNYQARNVDFDDVDRNDVIADLDRMIELAAPWSVSYRPN